MSTFISKRLRDHLTNPKRKKALMNRDTHRACLAMSVHACNECGGWETQSDTWGEELPVLHEIFCSFYPSLANIELEDMLEREKMWYGSKWDPTSENARRVKDAVLKDKAERAAMSPEEWLDRAMGRK